MKYRLLIWELLFTICGMIGIYAAAYLWTNSLLISLGMAAGSFWLCVFLSWFLHRSVK